MQLSVVFLAAGCLAHALLCEGIGSNVKSLDASPECAGEVRLSFEHAAPESGPEVIDEQAQHVVKRETRRHVIGVSYKPSDASPEDEEMHKEFTGATSTSSSLSLLIRGLAAGKKYQLRVRHGQHSAEGTEWGEYSVAVESVSGTVNAEAGPDGVGGATRNFCQSRRRAGARVASPKGSRVHQATFASVSRRRRSYYSGGYYYGGSYYGGSYYYGSSYNYGGYYYGGTTLGGAIAGGVVGFIFIIAAIVVCCKFYFYGGCGRTAYRNRSTHTTFVSTATVQPLGHAQPPVAMAMTTQPGAYSGEVAKAPVAMEAKPAYPTAPQATAYPPGTNAQAYAPAAYPAAPQGQQAPAWGGVAAAPYPTGAAAPPPYAQANQL